MRQNMEDGMGTGFLHEFIGERVLDLNDRNPTP